MVFREDVNNDMSVAERTDVFQDIQNGCRVTYIFARWQQCLVVVLKLTGWCAIYAGFNFPLVL